MKKFLDILKPAIILTVICVVLTLALAFTNLLTKEKIASLEKQAEVTALHNVIDADEFVKQKLLYKADGIVAYKAIRTGLTVGYAFTVTESGYGGDVSLVVGIQKGKVTAIEITDVSDETPGLGQDAKNTEFTDNFKGIETTADVPAMTGATITSTAVKNAVDKALTVYEQINKEVE